MPAGKKYNNKCGNKIAISCPLYYNKKSYSQKRITLVIKIKKEKQYEIYS